MFTLENALQVIDHHRPTYQEEVNKFYRSCQDKLVDDLLAELGDNIIDELNNVGIVEKLYEGFGWSDPEKFKRKILNKLVEQDPKWLKDRKIKRIKNKNSKEVKLFCLKELESRDPEEVWQDCLKGCWWPHHHLCPKVRRDS